MDNKNKMSFILGMWVFVIGCVLGYIIETIFYVIKYGNFVNKQGLIIGPFKPIYGIGCLLITIIYYLLKNKNNLSIFISGVICGTVFEYLASWFIEVVFKSYIWSYKTFKYNINGRIYLPYCIFWGLISIIWIKLIFPYILKVYDYLINKKTFRIVSVIISVFMILNVLVTGLVLVRQGYRNKDNKIFSIVDKYIKEDQIIKRFPKFRSLN